MRRSQKTLNTETVVRKMYECLVSDLGGFPLVREAGLHRIGDARCPIAPLFPSAGAYLFKQYRQLSEFHNRFIMKNDKSEEELTKEGFDAFISSQKSFALPMLNVRTTQVVHVAQQIVKKVLGEFSLESFATFCAPGKRAAYGLPRRTAYLDRRFKALSGSRAQKHWFDVLRCKDVRLMRMTRSARRSTKGFVCTELNVTAVPKSFKSIRTIAPDTVLGGFLSRGLGVYIRQQLEDKTHINLARQQDRHKVWAKEASVRGHLATIDMSKASDSFTWDHIQILTPRSWHPILRDVGMSQVNVARRSIALKSYMLMGQGHTFPLQTLLFYALCEASRVLLKSRGKVSVYGDDIILPTPIADRTMLLLTELGFSINEAKSFYESPDPEWPSRGLFRESCGGDYYNGVDVRPFMPQGSSQLLCGAEACAFLHKMYNGICERWEPEEIPLTLSQLLVTLSNHSRNVVIVPDFEGDEAGIRLKNFPLQWKPVFEPVYPTLCCETQTAKYFRVVSRKKRRKVFDQTPYLWYKLWMKQNSKWDRPFFLKEGSAERQAEIDEAALPLVDKLGQEVSRVPEIRYNWATSVPQP